MTTTTCQHCPATTTGGAALCPRCLKTVQHALTNIGASYADLDRVTFGGVRRRGSTASDPTWTRAAAIRLDPLTAADEVATNALTTWARVLIDDRPQAGTMPRTVPELAIWLSDHLRSISTLGWAGDMARDLLDAERQLKRVTERLRTGNYLGLCGNVIRPEVVHDSRSCACSCHLSELLSRDAPGAFACDVPGGCHPDEPAVPAELCVQPLYAPTHRSAVTCLCGGTWDVQARRQQLVRAAEDELLPVAGIARLAAVFTGEVNVAKVEARIRQWAARGKVEVADIQRIDGRPRRVYRVGDVLDLLALDTQNRHTA
jgi:hypothetical protein